MQEVKVEELLFYLEGIGVSYEFSGDAKARLKGFSSLSRYKEGTLTWCKKDSLDISERQFTCVVAPKNVPEECVNCIKVDNSKEVFFKLVDRFWSSDVELPDMGRGTYVGRNVTMGKNVKIGHNCSLEGDISIGDNTIIHNNVVIVGKVDIGRECKIYSGSVIGEEGVAFSRNSNGEDFFVNHYGGVRIGDRVRIYANCVINRGVIDDTIIGNDVVICGGTTIGHNCEIGAKVVMTPACKICGSVKVGDGTYLSGTTVLNQIKIGKNVTAGLGSVVISNIDDDGSVWGNPAKKFPVKKIL